MLNDDLSDLANFAAVADARSFTLGGGEASEVAVSLEPVGSWAGRAPEAASTHAHHAQRNADACGRAALEHASPRSGRDRGSAQCAQRSARVACGNRFRLTAGRHAVESALVARPASAECALSRHQG